jgi:hypothetical protein
MSGKKKLVFTVIVAFVLFFTNNILLGSIVPRMPGGSATGITTMFFITCLGLIVRQIGYIPLLFLIYGLIGLPSHLFIGDWLYLLIIFLMILCALIYDWILSMLKYSLKGHLTAFPLFFILTQICSMGMSNSFLNIEYNIIVYSLLLGYSGILLAFACYRIFSGKIKFFNIGS